MPFWGKNRIKNTVILLPANPSVGNNTQREQRQPIGAWPDLPTFVQFSVAPKSVMHQGPLYTRTTSRHSGKFQKGFPHTC
eukprot:1139847-Pelagomonas_calceolata.AAC.10